MSLAVNFLLRSQIAYIYVFPLAGAEIASRLHLNLAFLCEFEELYSAARTPEAQVQFIKCAGFFDAVICCCRRLSP